MNMILEPILNDEGFTTPDSFSVYPPQPRLEELCYLLLPITPLTFQFKDQLKKQIPDSRVLLLSPRGWQHEFYWIWFSEPLKTEVEKIAQQFEKRLGTDEIFTESEKHLYCNHERIFVLK